MIGITIGIGNEFERLAHEAANSMRVHTGLECVVLGEKELRKSGAANARLFKAHLLQYVQADDILYFDADIRCVNDWHPQEFARTRKFCVVQDAWWLTPRTQNECASWGLDPARYFNTGVFIANRKAHRLLFADVARIAKHYAAAYLYGAPDDFIWDQSLFNYAAQHRKVDIQWLDRRHNWPNPFGLFPQRVKYFNAHYIDRTGERLRNGDYFPTTSEVEFDVVTMRSVAGDYELIVGENAPRFVSLRGDGVVICGNAEHEQWWFCRPDRIDELYFTDWHNIQLELRREETGDYAGRCVFAPDIPVRMKSCVL